MTRLVNAADLEIANHAFRALLTSHADLLAALKAAQQFLAPDVERGPESNGWRNTLDLVEAAILRAEAPAR